MVAILREIHRDFVVDPLRRNALVKATRALDFSGGLDAAAISVLPVSVAPEISEQLTSYVNCLQDGMFKVGRAKDHAEDIFFGMHQQDIGYVVEIYNDLGSPWPKKNALKFLENKLVPDRQAAVDHITTLAAGALGVDPKEVDRVKKEARTSFLGIGHQNGATVAVTPEWELWLNFDSDANRRSLVNAFLIPLELLHYKSEWYRMHLEQVARRIQPDYLAKRIAAAIDVDYCTERRDIGRYRMQDVGGLQNVITLLEQEGWERVPEPRILRVLEERERQYAFLNLKAEESPVLVILDGIVLGKSEFVLRAVLTDRLKKKHREEFYERFRESLTLQVQMGIESGKQGKGIVDLSPDALTRCVVQLKSPGTQEAEYVSEARRLNTIAVEVLIGELKKQKRLTGVVKRLKTMMETTQRGELPRGATVSLGWEPQKIKLYIPGNCFS